LAGIQADFARSGKVLCEGTAGEIAGRLCERLSHSRVRSGGNGHFYRLAMGSLSRAFGALHSKFAWYIQILAYRQGATFFRIRG
jgi:hypothetical protein